jgi:hypothetical protein
VKGRPSKLTPQQWEEVGKRLAAGEQSAKLAREFGVSKSTLSGRFSAFPHQQVRKLGEELAALPVQAQNAAVSLADELRSVSRHLAAAARYGSATAHRLTALAHSEVQKIDDADPMSSVEALKGIHTFTRLANDAANIGMGLLAANKDMTKKPSEAMALSLNGSDVHG